MALALVCAVLAGCGDEENAEPARSTTTQAHAVEDPGGSQAPAANEGDEPDRRPRGEGKQPSSGNPASAEDPASDPSPPTGDSTEIPPCLEEHGFTPPAELLEKARKKASSRDPRIGQSPHPVEIDPKDQRQNLKAIAICQQAAPGGASSESARSSEALEQQAQQVSEIRDCYTDAIGTGADAAAAAEKCGLQ